MKAAVEIPVLLTCPNQHEWWVKVLAGSPPQPQPVVCPLCEAPDDVMLPRIVKIEVI
jgi:hypothetical protein